jgi:hypothetical protein
VGVAQVGADQWVLTTWCGTTGSQGGIAQGDMGTDNWVWHTGSTFKQGWHKWVRLQVIAATTGSGTTGCGTTGTGATGWGLQLGAALLDAAAAQLGAAQLGSMGIGTVQLGTTHLCATRTD